MTMIDGYWTAFAGVKTTKRKADGGPALRSDHLAISLLLDAADVEEDLAFEGVAAIYFGNTLDAIDLVKFFGLCDVKMARQHDEICPDDLVVILKNTMTLKAEWLAQGSRVLFVAKAPEDLTFVSMAREIDRSFELRFDDRVIRAFIYRWYGYHGDAPLLISDASYFWMSVDEIIFAARQSKVDDFLDKLRGNVATLKDEHHDVDLESRAAKKKVGEYVRPEPPEHKRLSEMTGFGEAGVWGMRLAADLRAFAQGELPWADVDKGILLSSPPGGGKTTFARALAAECGVPLFAITYTDIAGQRDVGGDSIARGLTKAIAEWRKAVEGGPVIVFFDEIDAIGKRGVDSRSDYWFGPLITGLLAFLDGAVPREGIVFVAATNYAGRVDPAMMRPGRLDRHIEIPAPDLAALAGMIAHHLDLDPKAPETLAGAKALRGRSPSQVEQACREARRMGRMLNRKVDGEDVVDLVGWSREKRRPEYDMLVAVHEAGHTVVGIRLGIQEIEFVDIDSQGGEVGGGVMSLTTSEPMTRKQVEGVIVMGLAGRAAEEVVLNRVTSGARGDLENATRAAYAMVCRWGLDGALSSYREERVTPRQAEVIEGVLQAAYVETLALVRRERHAINFLADTLLKERYMTGREVVKLLRDRQRTAFFKPYPDDYEEFEVAA